ncbi:MAG: hypothetical protein U9P50_02240 [Patescibacteria group bacterium]|nr:hypothetical protein [Patescibacteria group bacterium]
MLTKLKTAAQKKRWYDGPLGTIVLSMIAGVFLKGFFITIEKFTEIFASVWF